MTSIKYPSGVSNYFFYDSLLRRYAMEDSDGLRYFSWDYSGLKLLTERDEQGEVTALYSHGYSAVPGIGSVATAQKFESDTVYYQFPVFDQRGSVYRLTNDDGDVVFSAEYNAFGEVLDESNTGATNRLMYSTDWLTLKDSGNELVLSPARVYSSKLGRFLQKDFLFQMTLLGQQGSYWNSIFRGRQRITRYGLYRTFDNNPLKNVDSLGLDNKPNSTLMENNSAITISNDSDTFNGRHQLTKKTEYGVFRYLIGVDASITNQYNDNTGRRVKPPERIGSDIFIVPETNENCPCKRKDIKWKQRVKGKITGYKWSVWSGGKYEEDVTKNIDFSTLKVVYNSDGNTTTLKPDPNNPGWFIDHKNGEDWYPTREGYFSDNPGLNFAKDPYLDDVYLESLRLEFITEAYCEKNGSTVMLVQFHTFLHLKFDGKGKNITSTAGFVR